MSKISDGGNVSLGPGIAEQLNNKEVVRYNKMSEEEFKDLMMTLDFMRKLNDKIITGPKKKLIWKKE